MERQADLATAAWCCGRGQASLHTITTPPNIACINSASLTQWWFLHLFVLIKKCWQELCKHSYFLFKHGQKIKLTVVLS